MSEFTMHVQFTLTGNREELQALALEHGKDLVFLTEDLTERLREDLEDTVGSKEDWLPFVRSDFDITLKEVV